MHTLNLSTVNFNVNIKNKEEFPYKEAIVMHFLHKRASYVTVSFVVL